MRDDRPLFGLTSIIIYLIYIIVGIIEILIVLRLVMKFFGANPATPFVDWIYSISAPLVSPFAGIFPSPALNGQYVIEFSSLFALFIYALIGYLIEALVRFIDRRDRDDL